VRKRKTYGAEVGFELSVFESASSRKNISVPPHAATKVNDIGTQKTAYVGRLSDPVKYTLFF
jgi:hypothetical protein